MNYKTHFIQNTKLALPLMLAQSGSILLIFVDNIMVGKLGKIAIGSVGLANAIFIIALIFAIGFSYAMSPLIAATDAKDEVKEGTIIFTHGFILNTVIGFLLTLIIFTGIPLMHYFGQSEDVLNGAIGFLKIMLLSLVPIMIFQSLRQLSEGLSQTIPISIATFSAIIINIILNYCLIYGNFGFPKMGINGSALATLISRLFMIIILCLILLKKEKFKQYYIQMPFVRFDKAIFVKLIQLGLPSSLQMLFEIGAFSVAAFICGIVSKNDLAAHQIAISLASTTYMLCTGIAVASTIRIGKKLGKKNYKGMFQVGWSNIIMGGIFMLICSIVIVMIRDSYPYLFINNQSITILTGKLLLVTALLQIPDGIQVVALSSLRGMQDVIKPTVITFFSYWLVGLPLSWYLAITQSMGVIGVWIGLFVGLSVCAVLLLLRYAKLNKKNNKNSGSFMSH